MKEEPPILELICDRIGKRFLAPPEFGEDSAFLAAAWRNRTCIVRSVLISASGVLAATYASAEITEIEKGIGALTLPWWNCWPRTQLIGVLIILAVFVPWLGSVITQLWQYSLRHSCAPLVVIVTVAGLTWAPAHFSSKCFPFIFFGIGLFVSLTSIWWIKEPAPPLLEEDAFQRAYFVDRLCEVFTTPKTPLKRIAILGSWGSGKSMVLQLLRRKLEQECGSKFRTSFVNPWAASSPEKARAVIIEGFADALGLHPSFADGWNLPTWLPWLSSIKIPAGHTFGLDLKRLFEASSSDEEERLIARINDELGSRNATFVIFVDDMERSEPDVIRKMFPFIDKLRAIKHCFLVFAIDPDRIAKAFGEDCRSHLETKGYLDKVFDLQLELPSPRLNDIVRMCRKRISPERTPKLHAVFHKIAQYLPINPRDAIHFLDDAETKECLFLNRYGADEHEYDYFFLLRLLELGIPGATAFFSAPEIAKYKQAAYGNLVGINKADRNKEDADEILKGFWVSKTVSHGVVGEKSERLKKIFVRLLGREAVLQWACIGHMRLLTPSTSERLELVQHWKSCAGIESFEEMVASFSSMSFSDWQETARELLDDQLTQYEELKEKILISVGSDYEPLIEKCRIIVGSLTRHFDFASSGKGHFDLRFFGEAMFERWLKVVLQRGLDRSIPSMLMLSEEERGLHIKLVEGLAFELQFQYVGFSNDSFWVRRQQPRESLDVVESHFDDLREALRRAIYGHIIEWLRSGNFNARWNEHGMKTSSFYELAVEPEKWIPSCAQEREQALRGLAECAAFHQSTGQFFANLAGQILKEVNQGLGSSITKSRVDTAEFVTSNEAYTRCVWEAASHCVNAHALSSMLLGLRSTLVQICERFEELPVELVDSTFPMNLWNNHPAAQIQPAAQSTTV